MRRSAKLFWVEVVCVSCAQSIAGRYCRNTIPVKAMSKEAEEYGYKFVYIDQPNLPDAWDWRCMRCQEAWKETSH